MNTLIAPLKKILIGLLRSSLVKYWNWRIQSNTTMLAELEEMQELIRNHPLKERKDCLKVESLINSLHHANSSAYMELFKINGVGGVV